MTLETDMGPEPEGDDIVAAEYVLGVQSADERRATSARIDSDMAFARLVDQWEVRLSPMAAGYPEVEAPARAKAAIDRRVFQSGSAAAPGRAGFWGNVAFWRGLAFATLGLVALITALNRYTPPSQEPSRLVASLADKGTDVVYVVVYDAGHDQVSLSHVSGARQSGHDFELWMIEGQSDPVSMGVIPVGAAIEMPIDAGTKQKLADGAVLAVSLEPEGGSPSGLPTGPVVAAGPLKTI